MTESSLSLHLFRDQASQELKGLVSGFPTPHVYTSPSFLIHFVARLIDAPPTSIRPIGEIPNGKGTLIVIAPGDRDTVVGVCAEFRRLHERAKMLLVIPRSTAFVEQVLENHGFRFSADFDARVPCATHIVLREFHADFVPVDRDFFLLPSAGALHRYAVEGDFNDLFSCARALAKIQVVFGAVPRVAAVGEHARRVHALMDGILGQAGPRSAHAPQIDTLVIIDRLADLVTPLRTTRTLESEMDVVFGIRYGFATVPVCPGRPPELRRLDDDNVGFRDVRARTLEAARRVLLSKQGERDLLSKELAHASVLDQQAQRALQRRALEEAKQKSSYDECAQWITELLDVESAPAWRDTHAVERAAVARADAKNTDLIKLADVEVTMLQNWEEALRLICLDGAIGKIDDAIIGKVQKEATAEFGARAVDALFALERLKILGPGGPPKGSWAAIVKELKCAEEISEDKRDDWVPPTVRIIEHLTRRSLGQKSSCQRIVDLFAKRGVPVSCFPEVADGVERGPKNVLVFFVGGATLHEVALVRALSKAVFEGVVNFVIGATDQVNPKTFLRQICPRLFAQV